MNSPLKWREPTETAGLTQSATLCHEYRSADYGLPDCIRRREEGEAH